MNVGSVTAPDSVELGRLVELESVIESGLRTFHEVGSALLEIRDARLYRESHGTFEDYCRERWAMERAHAYRLIEASEVVTRLSPIGDTALPANEGQARALATFEPDLQPAIMRATTAYANGQGKPVTAGLIEGVGKVISEAATTGHVDIGDGTSTPVMAAIVAESFEHTQRQSQRIRDHYETHEANGQRSPHVSHNSGENEWYTPPQYIEAARRVMGGIDLDPASSDAANTIVKAAAYLTIETDGLAHDWSGRVWMNPPYSGDLVGRFVAKLCEHWDERHLDAAIVLVNNATETAWFQELLLRRPTVCFPKGRIRYLDKTGAARQTPLQGQAFAYFGPDPQAFRREFERFGVVL